MVSKTDRLIRQFKKQQNKEIRVPIATDMYLPNHSGISSHPEFQKATENFIETETDPVFSISPAFGITNINISAWNAKADYSFSANNFNGSGNFTTSGIGTFGKIRSRDAVQVGDGLMAIGTGAYASWGSTAIGQSVTASGFGAVAMGASTTASGDSSVAMGEYSTVSGYGSVAMGAGTLASGFSSVAMGDYSTANGDCSVAMGVSTEASGFSSVAMGFLTTASGDYSTAIGESVTASQYLSTAFGASFENNVANSFAVGFGQKDFEVKSGEVNITSKLTMGTLVIPTKATTGDPASPVEGQIYTNTYDNKVRIYTDGAWRDLATW